MKKPSNTKGAHANIDEHEQIPLSTWSTHARIVSTPRDARCLDALQLDCLEKSFRLWTEESSRADVRASRNRILLIFLLIRYTGAKLSEVLDLNPFTEIDTVRHEVAFNKLRSGGDRIQREVSIPEALAEEIQAILQDSRSNLLADTLFKVDPGHVRRKFYERASACGFPRALGAPDVLRKSRAVELLQNNVPLPVVQKILGHSTPNLTASYVAFSGEEILSVARSYIEKEARRKTTARNIFFGKICDIQQGVVQAKVEVLTTSGHVVTAVVTNDNLPRLGLKVGSLITAEVKALWVTLQKGKEEPRCTAENRFCGTVVRITQGEVTTEIVVRISDTLELCSVATAVTGKWLDLNINDPVWALFNAFSVLLYFD